MSPKSFLWLLLFSCLGYGSASAQAAATHPPALVIGHAGSGFLTPLSPFNPLPPNSMASLKKAFEHGADGVEVDVQLSSDGTAILYHDPTLNTFTAKAGLIDTMRAEQVLGVPYKAGFLYDLFQDEKIISLEQLLQYLGSMPEKPYLQLDLRNSTPERRAWYAATLMELLRKYAYPLQKLAFISPDEALLEAFRKEEPQATLLVDADDDFDGAFRKVLQHRFQGIVAPSHYVKQEQVRRAQKQGLQVILFGGKSRSGIASILKKEPDAVEVNNVSRMRKLLE
ncbi:glycerophosphodiester phosphodiesterase [Pontibacter chitinilyticus]|uniref:glycerophosphodiester phosphodiesterase n=1 Tax=Pontibacter chitinilyticus TaxID=2674989 RepID=UPI00321BAFF7